MAYRIIAFDGLAVSEYLQRGDSQDIGTGAALTNFLSLPGGGFYDNYRDRTSPQGIRPINKSGVFWGTDSELRVELDVWRAKLGKRGRVVVEFDDGALRWQWARLQDVSAPRPSNAKGGWLPFSLTWITAAQHWRGVVYSEEGWTWGDESWFWGDGSAEFGSSVQSFDVAASGTQVTVSYGGSIDATTVLLRFELTDSWEDLTVINHTTGQQIYLNRSVAGTAPYIEIDAGARAIYTGGTERTITTAIRSQNTLTVTTSSAHGLATGDTVRIDATGTYDGDYYPITVSSTTVFTIALNPRHTGYGTVTTGTVRLLQDRYSETTLSDRERWFVLVPGDNTIEVTWNDAPATATLYVEYVDHYA